MKEQVIKLIAEYKGVEPDAIDTSASWADLGFDSLDVTELMVRLEDELGKEVELTPEIVNIDALLAALGE